MVEWLDIGPNPDWQGPWPDPNASRCHDGSGYLEIRHDACGAVMHLHRSQLVGTDDASIVSPCHGCSQMLGMSGRAVREVIDMMWTP